MTYKLLIKARGVWQEVGFSHMTADEARNEARSMWPGYLFMVLPA